MSVYLQSEAFRSISVISAVAQITMNADKEIVSAGESIRFWGNVVDWAGNPVSGREVYVWWYNPAGAVAGPFLTDANGHWETSHVVPWGYSGAIHSAYASSEGKTSPLLSIPIGWKTRISISAPEQVMEGQSFNVTGILSYESSPAVWSPLRDKAVGVTYDGEYGSDTTGTDGSYTVTGTIGDTGAYILRAVFPGEGFAMSTQMSTQIAVGVFPFDLVWAIASAALGSALIILSSLK